MTTTERIAPSSYRAGDRRLVLGSRGDPLTDHLSAALERRFGPISRITPELTAVQRVLVAASTFRPTRERWIELFFKSGMAWSLRSRNAARQLQAIPGRPSAILQVHALFTVPTGPTLLYVDCTHHQSAMMWPAWNPLSGAALETWYRRERKIYHRAEHVFAFTRDTRDSLVEDYGVDPARVTVTGMASYRALPDRAPVRTVGGPPSILFVGNDFARKGGPELLAAFRTVRAQVPDARLLLVGTQPGIAAEPGVEVLGRIADERRMAALFAEASVFALPSIFDPLPGALIEAMAFGLPVIATRQMGVPEVITDGVNGRLVDPGSIEELANALLEILRNPEESARMGAIARRDVLDRFTWDAVVERMAPVLEPLLRTR